jgi:hypothetical protein
MADMKNWAQNRDGSPYGDAEGGASSEDPVPSEEVPPEEAEAMASGSKSPEQMENLLMLLKQHLPEIEEQVRSMEPTMLLSDDQELPEHDSDQLLELVDTWDDGFPELLARIAPEDAITLGEQVRDEIQELEPILIAAWMWRAGELT